MFPFFLSWKTLLESDIYLRVQSQLGSYVLLVVDHGVAELVKLVDQLFVIVTILKMEYHL